jgi:hypothetical protein
VNYWIDTLKYEIECVDTHLASPVKTFNESNFHVLNPSKMLFVRLLYVNLTFNVDAPVRGMNAVASSLLTALPPDNAVPRLK